MASLVVAAMALTLSSTAAQSDTVRWRSALEETAGLTPHRVRVEAATHLGQRAVRLTEQSGDGYAYAVVAGPPLKDGTIQIDVAGQPAAGSPEGARGFVGVAFRVQPGGAAFECLYLRPTNGRAADQLRRNHSTQYISHPGFTWQRLRSESPGLYESYVDLATGEWTHVRIEIAGARAALYVNRAAQPCLIVNDLKLPPAAGAVALWIDVGTEAYFRDLRVESRDR